MVQGAVLAAVQHRRGPSWIGPGTAMDRTWMSLGRFLDDLETGGSRGTRTKRELPANDRDPAGNLSSVDTTLARYAVLPAPRRSSHRTIFPVFPFFQVPPHRQWQSYWMDQPSTWIVCSRMVRSTTLPFV